MHAVQQEFTSAIDIADYHLVLFSLPMGADWPQNLAAQSRCVGVSVFN